MSEHTANDLRLYSETTISDLVAANWAMDDEIKKLKAENARLRAGLSEALDWNWLDDDAPDDSDLRELLGEGDE